MDPRTAVIGIDLGTSGCRAIAIDEHREEIASARASLTLPERSGSGSEQDPECWWRAVVTVLQSIVTDLSGYRMRSLAVDGTSSTLLATDPSGKPLSAALMYDDTRAIDQLSAIQAVAPDASPVHSASSSLAKLLHLSNRLSGSEIRAAHQADWILGRLTGTYGISDENNCLKLGYDAECRCWPPWMEHLKLPAECLPRVLPPGTPLAPIAATAAGETGLASDTLIVTGTTDSTAAALATGVVRPGEAVTVLGSTLVLKVVSPHPVYAPAFGVYSHRIGDHWLVGGASNSGGAICARYFTQDQMQRLTRRLAPERPTGLDYYPLLRAGERFPIRDPDYPPRITPRPADDAVFFQALLEGIGHIEKRGYELLEQLGAPPVVSVTSIGGGSSNQAWCAIRERLLGIPVATSVHQQAAYGTALLALKGLEKNAGLRRAHNRVLT